MISNNRESTKLLISSFRNTAQGTGSTSARVGGILAPYVALMVSSNNFNKQHSKYQLSSVMCTVIDLTLLLEYARPTSHHPPTLTQILHPLTPNPNLHSHAHAYDI